MRKMEPIHPGEVLCEEFLDPMGVSQYRLAKDISLTHIRPLVSPAMRHVCPVNP